MNITIKFVLIALVSLMIDGKPSEASSGIDWYPNERPFVTILSEGRATDRWRSIATEYPAENPILPVDSCRVCSDSLVDASTDKPQDSDQTKSTQTQSGQCTYTQAGYKYSGSCLNGKAHGTGTMTSPEGSRLNGQFSNGKANGQGKLQFVNGGYYSGSWLNNTMSGNGTRVYTDNSTYTGQFSNNKRNGLGKLVTANGIAYEGMWSNDKLMSGTGSTADGCQCQIMDGRVVGDCPCVSKQ